MAAEQFGVLRAHAGYSRLIAAQDSDVKKRKCKMCAGAIVANLANTAPRDAPRRIGR